MSCQACEKAQQLNTRSITKLNGGTYIRVGSGNVLIVGCKKHLEELAGRKLIFVRTDPSEPVEA